MSLTKIWVLFPRRQHYIEYLAGLVLKGRLDPVMIFDLNDAKQELRRRGKVPPAKDQEMSERDYLQACIQVTNTIPFPPSPFSFSFYVPPSRGSPTVFFDWFCSFLFAALLLSYRDPLTVLTAVA